MRDSIPTIIEQVARLHPDKPAIDIGREMLTYSELAERVNDLAITLVSRFGDSSEPVALLCSRGVNSIVGMLAVLRAGKFFVCLDSSHPTERLEQILRDARPALILYDEDHRELQFELGKHSDITGRLPFEMVESPNRIDLPPVDVNSRACLIYTSGSTGRPKGVLQRHSVLVSEISRVFDNHPISSDDRVSHILSPSVFAGLREIFSSLLCGACLFPCDLRTHGLQAFATMVANRKITICRLVPSMVPAFVDVLPDDSGATDALRLTYLSGEPMLVEHAIAIRSKLGKESKILNVFGTSETGTIAIYELPECCSELESVPMGVAPNGVSIQLTGDNKEPIPAGEIGQITVTGDCFADGYWQDSPKTTNAFSTTECGLTAFKMGDHARLNPMGLYEYCGRSDDQVQIHGHRVELGEIDRRIAEVNGVDANRSKAWKSPNGTTKIVAYYSALNESRVSKQDIREHLESTLPRHMIPAILVYVESFARSPSGKILRSELPEPEWTTPSSTGAPSSIDPRLSAVWQRHLSAGSGPDEDGDFFHLGGDSMSALEMMLAIERELGVSLPISVLFENRTLSKLNSLIKDSSERLSQLICINSGNNTLPLFLIHPVGCNLLHYQDIARRLSSDQTIYGIQPFGLNDGEKPIDNFEEMAASYIEIIKSVQPKGPYQLGGSSFGGTMAFEMTRQLESAGDEVALLALLDSRTHAYMAARESTTGLKRELLVLADRIRAHWCNFWGRKFSARLPYVRSVCSTAVQRIRLRLLSGQRRQKRPENLSRTARANRKAIRDYSPRPIRTRISLFRARVQPVGVGRDLSLGWQQFSEAGVTTLHVDGYHGECCREPHASSLATQMQQCLDEISTRN